MFGFDCFRMSMIINCGNQLIILGCVCVGVGVGVCVGVGVWVFSVVVMILLIFFSSRNVFFYFIFFFLCRISLSFDPQFFIIISHLS